MGKQEFNEYFLGFDVGTNSVGWAVTDLGYKLIRFNKKDMWGSRLFEEAQTAKERRTFRTARRRLERRKRRLQLLEDIFAEEINKIDDTFFIRLKESNLYDEDKSIKFNYPLFNDKNYTDREFYKEYPSIYHLRRDLIKEDKRFDIRLLFLALHQILKNRGHFLFEGQSLGEVKSFDSVFAELSNYFMDNFDYSIDANSKTELEEIILSKKDKNYKKTQFKKILSDKRVQNVFFSIVGCSVDLKDIFDNEEYKGEKIEFANIDYENEKRDELYQLLGEDIALIDIVKKGYDFMNLRKILKGESGFSESKVALYDEHKQDLKNLKYLFKKYLSNKDYYKFFRSCNEKINYPAYIGYSKIGAKKFSVDRCSIEDINKKIYADYFKGPDKKTSEDNSEGILLFKNIPIDENDRELYLKIKEKLGDKKFLEKLRSVENSIVPYQIHEDELEKILNNQRKYYPFLNEKIDGLTQIQRIIDLFRFRIPYYVGPLNTNPKVKGENTWVVRKDENKLTEITPWNFNEKVDLEKSAEEFKKRMINKCTYLKCEYVIAKNSLLYEEFSVLNELNKVKVDNHYLNTKLKNELVEELFGSSIKVSKKKFADFLKTKQAIADVNSIEGIDSEFNSKLYSYNSFKKILGKKLDNDRVKKFVEKCIKFKCIYGDEKKLFNKSLGDEYINIITKDEFDSINKRIKINGWGRLSEKFLTGIEFEKYDNTEHYESVMDALRKTNYNLNELLSYNFNLKDKIEELNSDSYDSVFDIENYVKDLYVSPSVRRSIIQTYKIAEEIRKITGRDPKKLFVEMARGGGEKGKTTEKRKDHIKELYKGLKNSISEFYSNLPDLKEKLDKYDDNRLRQKKLFLYFMQMGRSMYSGAEIDLNALMNSNIYDIDHIYPQSKTKDDSFNNIVLVEKKDNAEKSNELLDPETQEKMEPFWKFLREKKFISIEKYNRLVRNEDFTDEELGNFVARQLVTTRQSTLEIAKLFKLLFPDTEIVYSKASLVSEFREKFDILKVREVNDAHHAQDAYLNVVVGNVFNTKFTKNFWQSIKENGADKQKNEKNTGYNFKKIYESDVIRGKDVAWINSDDKDKKQFNTINTVKNMVYRKTVNATVMLVEGKGEKNGKRYGYFDANLKKKLDKSDKCDKKIIPNIPKKFKNIKLKNKEFDIYDMAKKYGYYGTINPMHFILFEYEDKNGEKALGFDRICIVDKDKLSSKEKIEEYIEKELNYEKPSYKRDIKLKQKIIVNGFPYRIVGFANNALELKNDEQLYLNDFELRCIKNAADLLKANKEMIAKAEKEKEELKPYIISFEKKKNRNDKNETYVEAIERIDKGFNSAFDFLCAKFNEKSYSKYFNSEKSDAIYKNKDEFIKLELHNKARVILELVKLFNRQTIGDLTRIGLVKFFGKLNGRKFESLKKLNIEIVDESVTGLFDKKENIK